jgi:hypothetical protein
MISGTHNQASEEAPRRLVRGCPSATTCSDRKTLGEKKHTHTHKEQPDQDLLIDEVLGVDWYRSDRKTQNWNVWRRLNARDEYICEGSDEASGRDHEDHRSQCHEDPSLFLPPETLVSLHVSTEGSAVQSGGFYWRRVG